MAIACQRSPNGSSLLKQAQRKILPAVMRLMRLDGIPKHAKLQAVGLKQKNLFGLYDMSGNVLKHVGTIGILIPTVVFFEVSELCQTLL